jgi:hypothetical protein
VTLARSYILRQHFKLVIFVGVAESSRRRTIEPWNCQWRFLTVKNPIDEMAIFPVLDGLDRRLASACIFAAKALFLNFKPQRDNIVAVS